MSKQAEQIMWFAISGGAWIGMIWFGIYQLGG